MSADLVAASLIHGIPPPVPAQCRGIRVLMRILAVVNKKWTEDTQMMVIPR